MTTLMGKMPKDTYSEIAVINKTGGLDTTLTALGDGKGTLTPLMLSTTAIEITGNMKTRTVTETVTAIPGTTGTRAVNLSLGSYFTATIVTGGATFTFTNVPTTGSAAGFVIELTNGGFAQVVWPTSIRWANGVAPTLSAAAVDLLVFVTRDGGTTWYGSARLGA